MVAEHLPGSGREEKVGQVQHPNKQLIQPKPGNSGGGETKAGKIITDRKQE